jgi:metallophosphoesterase (TIGR03768 family)
MTFSRRYFLKCCAGCATALGLEISPMARIEKALAAKAAPSYPISDTVLTTLDRTVVPVGKPHGLYPQPPYAEIFPSNIASYGAHGYGVWGYGPAFSYRGMDIQTGLIISPPGPDPGAVQLVSFFTLSDVHICDKESPAGAIYNGYQYPYPTLPSSGAAVEPPNPPAGAQPAGGSSSYSGIMLYTTQVLDAAVQTINALHKIKPFDFGICLGDAADNSQHNELRWFLDVMDGKMIQPSSGAHLGDGNAKKGHNRVDYQLPYQAAGLDKSLKWYQAVGNHDQFWKGSTLWTNHLRATVVGSSVLNTGPPTSPPNFQQLFSGRGYLMGVVDGSKEYGDIINVGQITPANQPRPVAADKNRRALSINYWMGEFFDTTSKPVGHGFTQEMVIKGFACYSFHPVPGIPLKIIVLDDTDKTGSAAGSLDQERYSWLLGQLEAGQTDNELMVICSHVPVNPYGYQPPKSIWTPKSCISDVALIKQINTSYSNVIMWVAGHVHRNTITPQPAKAGASPDDPLYGHGFWMVETPSTRDYPQQFRRFEIVRNSNRTLSIFVYSVDPAANTFANGSPSPALKSRTCAVAAQQIFGNLWKQGNGMDPYPSSSVLNAQLVIQMSQLTPGLARKLAGL